MNEQQQAMSRERWPLLEAVNMIDMLSYLGTSSLAERQVTDEIERVVDEGGVTLWGTFNRTLENDQRDEPREQLYISLGLDGDQPLRHYIVRLGGEPVGALSLFLGQEAAGIYNVEVAPTRQRRGVGTAMTRAVLEEARRFGYRVGVVGPTPESRSMYERLGFVLHRQALPMYWYPQKP